MSLLSDIKHLIDPQTLLTQFGYVGVFLIIFAESGLFFGFFFPGDSLLITAGILAATGLLHIGVLIPLVIVAAILGDQVGYWMGNSFGRRLFQKRGGYKDQVAQTEAFFTKHGNKTIILARFVPVVRTFTPIIAGIGNMKYQTFISFNIIGGLLWGAGITLIGYWIGTIPGVTHYLNAIIALIILVSLVPVMLEYMAHQRKKRSPKNFG